MHVILTGGCKKLKAVVQQWGFQGHTYIMPRPSSVPPASNLCIYFCQDREPLIPPNMVTPFPYGLLPTDHSKQFGDLRQRQADIRKAKREDCLRSASAPKALVIIQPSIPKPLALSPNPCVATYALQEAAEKALAGKRKKDQVAAGEAEAAAADPAEESAVADAAPGVRGPDEALDSSVPARVKKAPKLKEKDEEAEMAKVRASLEILLAAPNMNDCRPVGALSPTWSWDSFRQKRPVSIQDVLIGSEFRFCALCCWLHSLDAWIMRSFAATCPEQTYMDVTICGSITVSLDKQAFYVKKTLVPDGWSVTGLQL